MRRSAKAVILFTHPATLPLKVVFTGGGLTRGPLKKLSQIARGTHPGAARQRQPGRALPTAPWPSPGDGGPGARSPGRRACDSVPGRLAVHAQVGAALVRSTYTRPGPFRAHAWGIAPECFMSVPVRSRRMPVDCSSHGWPTEHPLSNAQDGHAGALMRPCRLPSPDRRGSLWHRPMLRRVRASAHPPGCGFRMRRAERRVNYAGRGSTWTNPSRTARVAASVRELTFSLARMLVTWVWTVRGLM